MIKFVITEDRFADACTVPEYIGVVIGNVVNQMSALPKFLVDEQDKYVVEIIHDEEGDIAETKNMDTAQKIMDSISVRRFEKLRKELTEAAKNIVNPPKGGSSIKQPPQ